MQIARQEKELQKMSKINTVLLDFDGTVVNTNNVILQSWQHTFRTLRGKEEPEENILVTFGEPLEITMEKFFPEVPVDQSIQIYRDWHHDNFVKMIELFPGMKELIVELKNREFKVALVTSRLKYTTELGLTKFGLKPYLDYVLTADETSKHKPDPEPINIALNRLESLPDESVMVGDTMFDILCARNAGVKSVAVDWSIALSNEQKQEADYRITQAEELLELLGITE